MRIDWAGARFVAPEPGPAVIAVEEVASGSAVERPEPSPPAWDLYETVTDLAGHGPERAHSPVAVPGAGGPAALLVLADVAAEHDEDLHRWNAEEHIPVRMGLPGWQRGRRFRRLDQRRPAGDVTLRRYLTFYEVAGVWAFSSPAYVAQYRRLTPWSERVSPTQRNLVRSCYELVEDV